MVTVLQQHHQHESPPPPLTPSSGYDGEDDYDGQAEDEPEGFLVFCRYDFEAEDASQLSFTAGDILRIVQTQDNGWWAALDNAESTIGWVPADFVEPMTQEMLYTYTLLTNELQQLEGDEAFSPFPESATLSPTTDLASPAGRTMHPFKIERIPGANRASVRMTVLSGINATVPPQPRLPVPQPSGSSPAVNVNPQPLPFFRPQADSVPLTAEPLDDSTPPSSTADRDRRHQLPPLPPPYPQIRSNTVPLVPPNINKDVPPTPPEENGASSRSASLMTMGSGGTMLSRSRSASATTTNTVPPNTVGNGLRARSRPPGVIVNDQSVLNRISLAVDGPPHSASATSKTQHFRHPSAVDHPLANRGFTEELSVDTSGRSSSVGSVPALLNSSDKDSLARVNVFDAQARAPWYLRPGYVEGRDLVFDTDGNVRGGSVPALVERLTIDPGNFNALKVYRHAFLLTFKSFTSADTLFDLLETFFRQAHPPYLDEEQFGEWREKKQKVAQTRTLVILREWLEEHSMLQEDPQIGPRLREFLLLIKAPPALQLTAKQTMQSLERLYSTPPRDPYESSSQSASKSTPRLGRKLNKALGADVLKIDANLLATQLTLLEARMYSRVRASECLAYGRTGGVNNGVITLKDKRQGGGPLGSMQNLVAFCATNDKLASWVKMSVLERDGLGKRAETIDHWIKVAEKCRGLQNLSSTSAIVAALSSVDIRQLSLTWALVKRDPQFQQLIRLTDPASGFGACRSVLGKTEGACVPFIGMYLTDLVHHNDRFEDILGGGPPAVMSAATPSFASPGHFAMSPPPMTAPNASFSPMVSAHGVGRGGPPTAGGLSKFPPLKSAIAPPQPPPPAAAPDSPRLVNWVKRMYVANTIDNILAFQARTYDISEDTHLYAAIESRLAIAAGKDQGSFWLRSQEVRQAEIAHADIRRGLEQAGF